MPRLRDKYSNPNLQPSDFKPTGVFSDNTLKDGVIPTFTARCGFIPKFGKKSKEGGSDIIGLDMGAVCGDSDNKSMIAIPFKWYDDDPYHHICVNTSP